MIRLVIVAVARVVGGAAGLTILLVGVPTALAVAAGWPLPTSAPAWDDVRAAFGGSSIADETIVKTIAVVGWLAWMQVLLATLVEVYAWVRGRAAVAVPLAGPTQALVRRLLLSMLVLGGTIRSAAPSVVLPASAASVVTLDEHDDCGAPVRSARDDAAAAPAPPSKAYVVQPRDSLWNIAERHLGEGVRWRELWNLNREIAQPDGRALTDPDLLRPGWVLRLPDDAVAVAASATVSDPPSKVAPPASSDPGGGEVPSSPPTFPTPSTPPTPPDERSPAGSPEVESEPSDRTETRARVGVASAGLLAAGIVATLTTLRRAQLRCRRPGHAIPVPQGEVADAEAVIRSVASLDRAERLDLAMRAFAACAATRRGRSVPPIQAVLAGDDIELLLSSPLDAEPGPFQVDAGGRAWTLPTTADADELEKRAADRAVPTPCLVPIGRIDERDLLVDLEAYGRTSVSGEPDDVAALLWAVAVGLATSQLAEDIRVVTVGEIAPGLDRLERIEPAADARAGEVRAEAIAMQSELTSAGYGSTLEARLAGGSWTPTVVVVSPEADSTIAADGIAAGGTGLAIVSATDIDNVERRISIDRGMLTVTPPGLVAAMPELSIDLRRCVGELVDLAVPDNRRETPPVIDLTAAPGGSSSPAGGLVVRVLGAVGIEGSRDMVRRKSEELVAYLALHDGGADEQRLKTALWPEGVPSAHAFNQMVSRTRIALGTAPDGSHHLPRLEGTTYRLGEWVTSDVEELERALRAASAERTPETIERLAAALRLVRGQPFGGVKAGYEWAHSEGFASRYEILIGEAAHLVADWHIEQGEASAALWAAGQGLLGCPVDEALYRDRMRAYDLTGNGAAVESVMRELCRVADAMEPYDSLHPETVELYERLTRRRVG